MSASCAAGWGAYLSLSLANGFHEKAFLVKVNVVVSEAEIKATKRTPLAMLPFALSLSLLFGGSLGARWVSSGVKALQSKVRPLLTRAIWRSHLYTPDLLVAAGRCRVARRLLRRSTSGAEAPKVCGLPPPPHVFGHPWLLCSQQ